MLVKPCTLFFFCALSCFCVLAAHGLSIRQALAKHIADQPTKRHRPPLIKNLSRTLEGITDFYPICDQVSGALGYPCETHVVQTEDGFLLSVIHIPAKSPSTAYPVVLQHGLLDSAITWVANAHPHQNLACILHDHGYDVWMPNSRGNHYSMGNIHYPSESDRNATYWRSIDMDWMAKYDLPAVIDYVIAHNNASSTKISWVGHSQGTWQAFSAFSTLHREYALKVDAYVALAPVTYIRHTTSVLLKIVAELGTVKLFELFGEKEFLNRDWLLRQISKLCGDLWDLCPDALELIIGFGNPNNLNSTQLPNILRYDPGGTSVNNMAHWAQEVNDGTYTMHNYGETINEEVYHQKTAPKYNISAMTLGPKTTLFWGTKDALADPTDVAELISALPVTTLQRAVTMHDYDHMDFVWGLDAHTRLYPQVVACLPNATV